MIDLTKDKITLRRKEVEKLGFKDVDQLRAFCENKGNFNVYYHTKNCVYIITRVPGSEARALYNMKQAKANQIYPTNLSIAKVKELWAKANVPGSLEVWNNSQNNTYFKIVLNTI